LLYWKLAHHEGHEVHEDFLILSTDYCFLATD